MGLCKNNLSDRSYENKRNLKMSFSANRLGRSAKRNLLNGKLVVYGWDRKMS